MPLYFVSTHYKSFCSAWYSITTELLKKQNCMLEKGTYKFCLFHKTELIVEHNAYQALEMRVIKIFIKTIFYEKEQNLSENMKA